MTEDEDAILGEGDWALPKPLRTSHVIFKLGWLSLSMAFKKKQMVWSIKQAHVREP